MNLFPLIKLPEVISRINSKVLGKKKFYIYGSYESGGFGVIKSKNYTSHAVAQ